MLGQQSEPRDKRGFFVAELCNKGSLKLETPSAWLEPPPAIPLSERQGFAIKSLSSKTIVISGTEQYLSSHLTIYEKRATLKLQLNYSPLRGEQKWQIRRKFTAQIRSVKAQPR